ncbi:ATP-binding protein [Motiliproteus coralliicola]|uniref:ATP-binding protein n=1 Tax=Motiliproteus coralliicola TaxID=2283196 RepID=UPI001402DBBB|nr:ATP-binding protein [Motiliproteus coralliicola]
MLSAVLVVVISLVLIGWLSARHYALERAGEQLESSIQADLKRLAQFSNHWLSTSRSFLEYSAATEIVHSMNTEQLKEAIQHLAKFIPTSNLSMVLNRQGVSIARSDGQPGRNYSNQPYFKAIFHQHKPFAFQLTIDKNSGEYMMWLAVPITETSGLPQGVLVSSIDPRAFQSQVKSLFADSQRDYLVLASDLSVVASTAHPKATNSVFDLQGSAYPECNLSGTTRLVTNQLYEPRWGREILLTGCHLESGWQVLVVEDPLITAAVGQQVDRWAMLALVSLLGVAFLSSLILTRLVISRLNQLGNQVVSASISGARISQEQDHTDDEFTQFRQTVSVAMYGQRLLNQLIQCSYDSQNLESFVHESLELINTAPWVSQASCVQLFITLTDDPDLFHNARITASGFDVQEIIFEQLESQICDCIATNQLVHKVTDSGTDSYAFPIYLDNMSGACFYIEFSQSWQLDDQQTHFTLTFLDIFASVINHLNARFSLQRQEELTHQIIDNSDLTIVVRSLAGEITLCNKGFERLYDVDRSIYRHFMSDMLSADQQFQLQQNDEIVIFKGIPVNYDETIELENGDTVYLQTVKFPIKDANNKVTGIGSVSTDISSRLQMEKQLQASYHNLEEQVLKRTRDLHDSNKELTKQKVELESLIQKLEEAQTQLIQAEKLASIGQLAAGVAHEINNPVGFVNSNLGSLQKYVDNIIQLINKYEAIIPELSDSVAKDIAETKEQLDFDFVIEDVQELIDESIEGLERVKKIVLDLKSFSRADQGDWEEVSLHDCLDSTLNVVWNELKYKAELVKNYQDIPHIICNASQINQVIINLLLNAAQAIEDFGQISITTGHNDDGVWLEVHDNGSGIPEHIQSRVFDPFFTTKDVGKGTGLGLSVSYNIVQSHGGDLSFKSTQGEGTCFRLWLPLVPPANKPTEPSTHQQTGSEPTGKGVKDNESTA